MIRDDVTLGDKFCDPTGTVYTVKAIGPAGVVFDKERAATWGDLNYYYSRAGHNTVRKANHR